MIQKKLGVFMLVKRVSFYIGFFVIHTTLSIAQSESSRANTKVEHVIEIVSYDPEWPMMFEMEVRPIQQALGKNCVAIHHFGSTSVPGLDAKPKIDILAAVKCLHDIDREALERIGFASKGEVIPTGRYFSKELPKVHLHIFEEGNPMIERNLMFRNYLRTHEESRNAYAAIKKKLATLHTDGMDYCRAKTEFINQIIEKAQCEKSDLIREKGGK